MEKSDTKPPRTDEVKERCGFTNTEYEYTAIDNAKNVIRMIRNYYNKDK